MSMRRTRSRRAHEGLQRPCQPWSGTALDFRPDTEAASELV